MTDPAAHDAEAEDVLAGWRGVQRRLLEVPDGTPEAVALQAEAGRLRREYQMAVRQAVAAFRASGTPDTSDRSRRSRSS